MNDFAKTRIVIVGVKTGIRRCRLQATAHNAPGAPTALTGCPDGIFTVVRADIGGKQPLPVAKHRAILVVPKRSTLVNQCQHAAPLGRQLGSHDNLSKSC